MGLHNSASVHVLSDSLTAKQEDVCEWGDCFYLPSVSLKNVLMGKSFIVMSQHFPSVKIDNENGWDRTLLWFKIVQITLIKSSWLKTKNYGTRPEAMDAQHHVQTTLNWCNSEYQQLYLAFFRPAFNGVNSFPIPSIHKPPPKTQLLSFWWKSLAHACSAAWLLGTFSYGWGTPAGG